jgi:MFS family permease
VAGARRLTSITALLFACAILDELSGGVSTTGATDIELAFGMSHASTTLVLFAVPGAIALFIEPIVFLLAERFPRRWFIPGGVGVMAAASFGAALAPGPITLAITISIWEIATGASSALSQATLVDRFPDHRARTMARWTLLSLVGDLAAPLVLGGLAAIDLGWRAGLAIVGGVLAVQFVLVTSRAFPEPPASNTSEAEPSLWQSLRSAIGDRVLIGWLFGMALCELLDEILIVFASLHIRHELGAGPAWQSAVIIAFVLGGAAGLVVLDRLLTRHSERRLLIATSLACVVCYAAWLASPTPWLSTLLMIPVGATSAPLYPLSAARAYARCPGRSGVVLVASHLFRPLGLALPWLIGIVADHAGTPTALALLVVGPLGLALLARATR